MTNTLHLKESTAEAPVKKGKRWRVIVARPGKGSSGVYSEELFRRDAHKIIAPGAQSFINHDSTRNPKDMIGIFPEAAYFDENEKAVVAELEVFSHWEKFVDEVGPHCGISLYALGEADEDGNVTAIVEDRLNGADLVSRPGLVGSGLAEKLYESAVAHSEEKPSVTVAQESNGDELMEEKLDKLIDLMSSLVAEKKTEDSAKAQVEADEAVAEARVESFAAAVKAVDEADLFDSQRETILEAAKKGADVSALIESAKTVKAEALEYVKESAEQDGTPGVVLGARKVESATDLGKVFG